MRPAELSGDLPHRRRVVQGKRRALHRGPRAPRRNRHSGEPRRRHCRQSRRPVLRRRVGPECWRFPATSERRMRLAADGEAVVKARRVDRARSKKTSHSPRRTLRGPGRRVLGVVAVLLATGRPHPAKVAGRTPVQSTCAKALLKDWADGRIDATYRLECYRAALKSPPVDLQVYSQAPEDISGALAADRAEPPKRRLKKTL